MANTQAPMTEGPAEVMYGTPQEVANRLGLGVANTESHFTQAKHDTSRAPSIREIQGKVVRNGKMGGDLNHSAS